ncbi:FAD-binding oxidoreductase [Defluviimonas aestuarii]|uniref:FAD-binding oxidoreductase n=1 Tax=Albidovulum aestuarii TaxID=1130726 RepID=UPI00249B6930|nr:FAD-binding oxidoreductase [Defluviimonas aestuarii]MDI3337184.1 FAD-binding oxidoreductase [Defluviimonas aestuarii]
MQPSGILRELLGRLPRDIVIDPEAPSYESLRRVWNDMIDRRPSAIIRPGDVKQVSEVVRLAATTGLPLAVRCGGHSFPGFSTCDGGIVLDLSRMNTVSVDPEARLANVGGGALLRDVDRATAKYGLVVPAGVVSHTGAGGLTLGGGMGWTSRRFGLTIDNLVSAEVVTANGEILEVSDSSHPDLFWGLRGGGGNFGIVTRFQFRVHTLGPISVGVWNYAPTRVAEALEGLSALAKRAPRSQTHTIGLTKSGLRVTAFYNGPDGLGHESVAPFGNLAGPGDGGLEDMDFLELQSRSDDFMRWGRRYYGKGGFFGDLNPGVIREMADLSSNAPNEDSEFFMIHLGGAVSDVSDDATAYTGRQAEFFWLAQAIWDDALEDEQCLSWGREAGQRLEARSQVGNYVNEQSDVGQRVSELAYGKTKYNRLAALKAKYDPSNLFRLNQNIAPAHGVSEPNRDQAT